MDELIEKVAEAMWDDAYPPDNSLPKWKELKEYNAPIKQAYRRMAKIAIEICESKKHP